MNKKEIFKFIKATIEESGNALTIAASKRRVLWQISKIVAEATGLGTYRAWMPHVRAFVEEECSFEPHVRGVELLHHTHVA